MPVVPSTILFKAVAAICVEELVLLLGGGMLELVMQAICIL